MTSLRQRSVVGLLGGLGNQMFQYAFGLWLGKNSDRRVTFDTSALRSGSRKLELAALVRSDCLPIESWLKIMPYPRGRIGNLGEFIRTVVGPKRIFFEADIGIPNGPSAELPPAWWYGYWQSPRIVQEVLGDVRVAMKPGIPDIISGTVGIHLRRGDYVNNPMLLPPAHYREALNSLIAKSGLESNPFEATVFSDDPTWCKKELIFDVPVRFSETATTIDDFRALMRCEYLVLSRSTFSWWAAVLPNRNPSNVISPYPFTPDSRCMLDYPGWLRQAL